MTISRRRVPTPRTLRGRLVAVLIVVLTVGFAAAALITVAVVDHVLLGRLDAQLRTAGARFALGLEHPDADLRGSDGGFASVEGQAAGTLGARLYQGRVTAAAIVAGDNTADSVPAAARARLATLTANAGPHSIVLPDVGSYRIFVTRGRDNDLLVTGLPLDPVQDTINRLVIIEVIVFASVLLVVGLVSTGIVRLMLRPLARVADTASDVSAHPLTGDAPTLPHRVPIGSHGSEVDTLAVAFNTMLDQVESALVTRAESEDRLRRFVADASHELRTPVAVIRGHAELAQRRGQSADRPVPADLVHSLERITAQTERMGHLVEDLLLLARLDSGRPLEHRPVDLARLALDALDDVRVTAADHRWRLAMPAHSVWVYGDSHALGQAVSNLLANAAAHTPPGTQVTLTVAEQGGSVTASVADDGPGMSRELATRAFDRFVRGDGERTMTRGSSGLGLPIVAAIAKAHGGGVGLDSGPAGTTVRLSVPVAPAEVIERHVQHTDS